MPKDLREQLLATYADLGEAMVIQNLLEAEGITCRIADLGHVPNHMFGIAGGMNRSVGLYVLDVDVERATSLLATLAAPENSVDEESLAAEAEAAAATPSPEPEPEPAPARVQDAVITRAPSIRTTSSRSAPRVLVVAFVAVATLLVVRACS